MRDQFIKILDEDLDLDKGVAIATTFQNGSITDLVSRYVSHTNEIKIPDSERNRRILGFPNLLTSRSLNPYTRLAAQYLTGGTRILKGTAEIRQVAGGFGIALYDSMTSVFTRMGEKLLGELDFGDSPITWNAAFVDSKRNTTSGLVAPVIQYGQIDTGLVTPAIGTYPLPSIYVKDVFVQIFTEAGVTLQGEDFLQDSKFMKLVFAYSRNDWPGITFTKAQILPDIKQVDFVKDLAIKFCLKFSEREGVVTIKKLNTILRDRTNVDDWTGKQDKRFINTLQFKFSTFAQRNNFDSYYLPVVNENLELTRDVYNSVAGKPFSDTFTVNDGANVMNAADLRLWNALPAGYSTPFDNENSYRLLQVRNLFPGSPLFEPNFDYNGSSRSDCLVGFFDNSTVDLGYATLNWRSIAGDVGFLDLYYDKLEQALQYCKFDQRQYWLDERDIHDMDITKLMYDSGEYFLRDLIQGYIPGRLTRVNVLKIW